MAPSVNEGDLPAVTERGPIFAVEYSDASLQVEKKDNIGITSQLVDSLTDISFQIKYFKPYIENFANYKNVTTKN